MTMLRKVLGLQAILPVAAALAGQPIEVGEELKIRSEVLGEERTILVRTPDSFDASSRYPVLYLTDGETQFLHTAATVGFLARNTLMPEMIVVGITNTDRTRDLTPTRASMRQPDGTLREFPTSGGADRFLDFIEQELVPFVEERYHPAPYRVFAGHSLGGLFAVHALLNRPALFGASIAVSPALGWDDQLAVRQARELLASRSELEKTLIVTIGGDEPERMQEGVAAFNNVANGTQPKGFVFATRSFEGEDHGSVVLPSHVFGLRKVFEGWEPPLDAETGVVVSGLSGLKAHYAQLSKRFDYEIQPPEGLVNRLGYASLTAGKTDEAIAIFELNVSGYPGSANVYDSLGEGLEAAGRLEEAAARYEEAVARGKKARDPRLTAYEAHLEAVRKKLE